ncbi:MAG: hypothetical protein AAF762_02865 [Pseudomonadota bacterium]
MAIGPFYAKKQFSLTQSKTGGTEKDIAGLEAKVADLSEETTALTEQLNALSKDVKEQFIATALVLDGFALHPVYLREAGIMSVRQMAAMDGNDRRSAYAKIRKSDAFGQAEDEQLTKSQFDEICEKAKRIVGD